MTEKARRLNMISNTVQFTCVAKTKTLISCAIAVDLRLYFRICKSPVFKLQVTLKKLWCDVISTS